MFALKLHSKSQTADNSRGEISCPWVELLTWGQTYLTFWSHPKHTSSQRLGHKPWGFECPYLGCGSGLHGELPLDPLSLCLMGMGEEELLEDELEKGLTTWCCEQFGPPPFPLGLFTDSLDCFVVFLLRWVPLLRVLWPFLPSGVVCTIVDGGTWLVFCCSFWCDCGDELSSLSLSVCMVFDAFCSAFVVAAVVKPVHWCLLVSVFFPDLWSWFSKMTHFPKSEINKTLKQILAFMNQYHGFWIT